MFDKVPILLLMKKYHDIFLEVFEEVDLSDDDFSSLIIQTKQPWKSQDDINATIASCLNETQSVQQSTLIGTSAEREQLRKEQQKAFEDLIARDRKINYPVTINYNGKRTR